MNRRSTTICVLLILLSLAAFWRVIGNEFINYDDPVYVTENRHVQSGLTLPGITWAFTTGTASNWHPLTWISHMADVSLYGLKPAGHHVTSLILHILNTLLLFLVLLRLTANPVSPSPPLPLTPSSAWKCAFVAALFAIHPLHVESVAWIAERKDVLSTLFFLLVILAYVRYVEHPGVKTYAPVVLALGLGLMAKPMLVTLPFVLLLLDYWPLGRFNRSDLGHVVMASPQPSPVATSRTGEGARGSVRNPETRNLKPVTQRTNTQHRTPNTGGSKSTSRSRSKRLLLEKAPLLLLAFVSSAVTYVVQHRGEAVGSLHQFPLGVRVANALVAYIGYIRKMYWPSDLAIFYPHPGSELPVWQVAGAAFLLACVTCLVIRHSAKRPYLAVGWFWYLGTLVPVIGLVQVGGQAMADRYTYVPLIGLSAMIVWGIPDLISRGRVGEGESGRRNGLTSNVQLRTPDTRDPKPVTPHSHTPLAIAACVILIALAAVAWRQVGHWHDSVTLLRHAIRVTDRNVVAHTNLGVAYEELGDTAEAAREYEEALKINPADAEANINLGIILGEQGKFDEAVRRYEVALQGKPKSAAAHNNLGLALANLGRLDEAIQHYTIALELQPDGARTHNNLGLALADQGRIPDAIAHYMRSIEIDPSYADVHSNLGIALISQGKTSEAITELREALRFDPDLADAHNNLGLILVGQKKYREAIGEYRDALRLAPDYPEAHNNLAIALYLTGDYAEAWREVRECLKYGGRPHPAFLKALSDRMPEVR